MNTKKRLIGLSILMLVIAVLIFIQANKQQTDPNNIEVKENNNEQAKKFRGLYTLLSGNNVPQEMPELEKYYVSGVSARFHWKVIEPEKNIYDWTLIDQAVDLAEKYNKKLIVRVVAGLYIPEWVFDEGATKVFATHSNPEGTLEGYIPPTWDPIYKTNWLDFIQVFGQRYNSNDTIVLIEMTGGGHAGETFLAPSINWFNYGYSDELMIATWKEFIDAYARAFPQKPIALGVGEPKFCTRFLIGNCREVYKSNISDHLVSWCNGTYPNKVYIQQNGLKADWSNEELIPSLIKKASDYTSTGYQMVGSINWLNENVGDRKAALQNGINDGATYFEIYTADFQASLSQPNPSLGLTEDTWIWAYNQLETKTNGY